MTTDLWKVHREKDLLWKINTTQAVLNHKQEQNEANKEVAMELETEQTVNATQLSTIFEKMLDDKLRKEKSKQQKTLHPMPKAKHQRPQNMVMVQTTNQIVEERAPTRTYPKNLPETNAAGSRAEDEPKQDQNKHKDPRAEAKTETKTNHHPSLH
jgi:hypothetical protein